MSDRIWFCDLPRDTYALIGFVPGRAADPDMDDAQREALKRYKAAFRRDMAGEVVAPEDVPHMMYFGQPGEYTDPLPPAFFNGFVFLRDDAADIFMAHDLGDAALFPVDLFQNDRTTPVLPKVHALNRANRKATLNAADYGLRRMVPGQELFNLPRDMPKRHKDFTAPRATLDGPDLWVDPTIVQTMFLSDRLAQALISAKIDKEFSLYPCAVA